MFLHADSEDCSDRADAQGDLSHHWAHSSFCWFCHKPAHLFLKNKTCHRVDMVKTIYPPYYIMQSGI